MPRVSAALLTVTLATGLVACASAQPVAPKAAATPPGATLWVTPGDLERRDLFYGPWGKEMAPDPAAVYAFKERKRTGVNPGMTVVDPQGREWSVKQAFPGGFDGEGRSEVAVSRLLSAVGYHQPPVYYLPAFTLEDEWGRRTERGGRFRLKEDSLEDVGSWSWLENPFVGTQAYRGLLVLLMMFNSTDMKDSNNTLYAHKRGDLTEHWYVVRDVGAALGDTHSWAPRKGDAAAFERQAFIVGVSNGNVEFAYRGWYSNLVAGRITPSDVAWAADLLGRLSDAQWQDAFRAAGFARDEADRFSRKLKEKIEQGRLLTRRAANTKQEQPTRRRN